MREVWSFYTQLKSFERSGQQLLNGYNLDYNFKESRLISWRKCITVIGMYNSALGNSVSDKRQNCTFTHLKVVQRR